MWPPLFSIKSSIATPHRGAFTLPNPAERLPGSQRHPPQRRGTRTPLPPKVLWTVISKTIAWMAALIENNEGHIEHMVAVVSPYPISPTKKKKVLQSKLGQTKKKKKTTQKVCATSQRTFAVNFALDFLMSRCPLFERRALPRSATASGSSESCGNRGISTADSSCAQITREMTSRSSLKKTLVRVIESGRRVSSQSIRCACWPACI